MGPHAVPLGGVGLRLLVLHDCHTLALDVEAECFGQQSRSPRTLPSSRYKVRDADLRAFQFDGAVVLRNVVDEHWISVLRETIDRCFSNDEWYFHFIYMWQREPALADFCFNSPLAEIASQLLCTTKVNLLYHQIFVKDSGEIAERTDWHNDLAYWPVRGSAMSLWLALDEVDEERGALEFIRGSHDWNRWFDIVGPVERNSDFEPLPNFDAERDKHEMLSWQMQQGDVVGFHALTVHGAYANRKPNYRRRGYALRFTGADAKYFEGPGPVERFCNAYLKHGQALDREQYPVAFANA